MNNVTAKQRNYGIDLLRMFSMLLVTLLHVLLQGGILDNVIPFSTNYCIAWMLEIFAYCAVNCYALISGYVGIDSKFKWTNLIVLWLQIVFYTMGITIIYWIFMSDTIGLMNLVNALFPIMTMQYWYATCYFGLFIMTPFLNAAVNALPQKKLRNVIISMIILFSVFQTLSLRDIFGMSGGSSVMWLAILYIIGAYVKRHGLLEHWSSGKCAILYVAVVVFTWCAKIGAEMLSQALIGSMRGGKLFVSYTSPTILAAALSLLVLFAKLKICPLTRKVIGILSPAAFGVYLIHVHPLVWANVMKDRFVTFAFFPGLKLLFAVVFATIAIYLICSAIDVVRIRIFGLLKVKERVLSIENFFLQRYSEQ